MSARRLTGGRCECPTCGLYFTSPREFDRHRAGRYAEPEERTGTRHCRSLAVLLARGWRMDLRGFLSQGRPERAPAGLGGHEATLAATGVGGGP